MLPVLIGLAGDRRPLSVLNLLSGFSPLRLLLAEFSPTSKPKLCGRRKRKTRIITSVLTRRYGLSVCVQDSLIPVIWS